MTVARAKSNARRHRNRLVSIMASLVIAVSLTSAITPLATPSVAFAEERVHVVQAGETLSQIARKYNVDLTALAEANGISSLDVVYVGQRLVIPEVGARARVSYTVQPGETLFSIALRYNLSPAALAAANGIADPSLIQPGQVLSIPTDAQHASPQGSGPSTTRTHVVQAGESLASIGDRYSVAPIDIIRANSIDDPELIQPGVTLLIPGASQASAPPAASTAAPASAGLTHTVREGEGLVSIADRYGVSTDALAALNGISDYDMIVVGHVLKLPAGAKPAAASVPTTVSYVVEAGDTLNAIALAYGVDVAEIRRVNSLEDAEVIVVGQKLTIPNPKNPNAVVSKPQPPAAPKPQPAAAPTPPPQPAPQPVSVADGTTFRVTKYCLQGRTASGVPVGVGIAAADASTFRLGQKVEVDGLGVYTIADRFAHDAGQPRIDIWVSDCSEALNWGIQYRKVRPIN